MKALLLLTALLLSLPAQDKSPAPHFSVKTDKRQYFVGEPVDLTFTLKNQSNVRLRGVFQFGFALNNLRVNYSRNGARSLLFVSSVVRYNAATNFTFMPTELLPGGSATHAERLLYTVDPAGLLLSEPGEYEFRATVYYQPENADPVPLESNAARVTVRAAPESEREALAAWKDSEMLDFIQGNDGYVAEEKFKAGMSKAYNFVQSYGASIYAPAAKKGLLDYLTPRAEGKRLTPEEQVIYERLSAGP